MSVQNGILWESACGCVHLGFFTIDTDGTESDFYEFDAVYEGGGPDELVARAGADGRTLRFGKQILAYCRANRRTVEDLDFMARAARNRAAR